MKSRVWIIILFAIVSVIFWVLWPHAVRLDHRVVSEEIILTNSITVKNTGPALSLAVASSGVSSTAKASAYDPDNRAEAVRKLFEAKNVPIDFYGQTLDQDGNPLSDVDIRGHVRHYGFSAYGDSIRVDRKSDSNGMFDVHDMTGDAFGLEGMSKAGYELEPTHLGFGSTCGSATSPVVFRLWRNDIKEPLITGQRSFDIRADGSPCILSVTSNGFVRSDALLKDFSLRLNIPQPQDGAHPNWSFEFEAAHGGIAEELNPSAAMYRAPEGGYTNLFRFVLDGAHPWTRSSSKYNFYFYLADRNVYGRISFELMFFRNKPPYIRTEYAINPTGSRILK